MPELTQDDIAALIAHGWPGNVRELRHVMERFLLFTQQGVTTIADAISGATAGGTAKPGLREAVAAFERHMIGRAIQDHAGRMGRCRRGSGDRTAHFERKNRETRPR